MVATPCFSSNVNNSNRNTLFAVFVAFLTKKIRVIPFLHFHIDSFAIYDYIDVTHSHETDVLHIVILFIQPGPVSVFSRGIMSKQRIWAVGGGKGGVGKSLVATNLSVVLANLGGSVVAVDLDFGNANMHTCFGIRYPRHTLLEFFSGACQDLNDLLIDTSVYNLKFISGSGGIVGSAPGHTQKLKLIRYLERLRVDHIVLDLGAGTSFNTIDFFLGATDHIIVTTPETPSIQSAYNFIRICLFRTLYTTISREGSARDILERAKVPTTESRALSIHELLNEIEKADRSATHDFRAFQSRFHPKLILNMILREEEDRIGWGIRDVVKRFLDVDLSYVGSISFDRIIRESVTTEIPYIVNHPESRPSNEFYTLSARIMNDGSREDTVREIVQREIRRTGKTYGNRVVQSHNMQVDPSIYLADRVRDSGKVERKEFPGLFQFKTGSWSKIAIDLGTSCTRIFAKGRGLILSEPSLMSIEEGSGKIVAIGRESKAMLGRSHSGISIVAPMEKGAISDYTDVKRMISEFIRVAKRSAILIRPGVVLTIPPKLTNVEKRAVREFINDLGAREVHLVYEPLAAAIGAGLPVDIPSASMLVNIGAGSTSATVISISGIVALSSERIGGNTLDDAIVRYLREKHNFFIGDQTAEWVKINYGQAYKSTRDRRFEVRGQDLSRSVPKILAISTAEIREALTKPVDDIVKVVMHLLERVPPELSGDLVHRGMTLTGGGALLEGLDLLLREQTGIPVRVAPNAITAAAEGAGRMLDDFSLYRKFFVETMESAESAESPHQ